MSVDILLPEEEQRLIRLAREVAMDMAPLEEVLGRLGFTLQQFSELQRWPKFQRQLAAEVASWESAVNTHERVKLKSAAMIEDWLPEAHQRLHDRAESLAAKGEVAKLITRLAGMGEERNVLGSASSDGGQRFTLVINIGDRAPVELKGPIEELPALPVKRIA